MDNYFLQSFHNLDAISCNRLADYLESQALMLRRRARDDETRRNGRRDGLENLHKAAFQAVSYYRAGTNKVSACRISATEFGTDFVKVEAVLKKLLDEESIQARKYRRDRAFRLRRDGKSIREIAREIDLSPARVQQILKS